MQSLQWGPGATFPVLQKVKATQGAANSPTVASMAVAPATFKLGNSGMSFTLCARVLESNTPRVCPTTGCAQTALPPSACLVPVALVPQGFLDPLQAVNGKRTVLAGLQETLNVRQEDVAGWEEACAQPEQFPTPLLTVPAGEGPE